MRNAFSSSGQSAIQVRRVLCVISDVGMSGRHQIMKHEDVVESGKSTKGGNQGSTGGRDDAAGDTRKEEGTTNRTVNWEKQERVANENMAGAESGITQESSGAKLPSHACVR